MLRDDFDEKIKLIEANYDKEFDDRVMGWIWNNCGTQTEDEFQVVCDWLLTNKPFLPKIGDFKRAKLQCRIEESTVIEAENADLWRKVSYYKELPNLIHGDVDFEDGKLLGYQKRMFMDVIRPLEIRYKKKYDVGELGVMFFICRKISPERFNRLGDYILQQGITTVGSIIDLAEKDIRNSRRRPVLFHLII